MNDILSKCIDQIWYKYDDDNSGYLDREEAKKFVMESVNKSEDEDKSPKKNLTNMEKEKKEEEARMSDKAFEACFSAVDDDNNGSISKDEML